MAIFVKLETETFLLVFALEQKVWHDTLVVCKLLVTIILNITQEVLRGISLNPLSSRHSPSYSQHAAVTQFPLVNQASTVAPFFACWFSSMEKQAWLRGSVNFQFAGTMVVFPVGSIPF